MAILLQKQLYGGICGDRFSGKIVNCLNCGAVKSNGNNNYGVGGICGNTSSDVTIENCINRGKISYLGKRASWYFGGAGGIIGLIRNKVIIKNTINIGSVESTSVSGAICGMELYYWSNGSKYERENLYYLDNVKLCTGSIEDDTENIKLFHKEEARDIVTELNDYIEKNEKETDYLKWNLENDGYPGLILQENS